MALRRREPDNVSDGEAIRRGQRAEAILNDPVYREARDRAAERFYEQWLMADTTADREALWAKTHALEAVDAELRGIQSDGEVAASKADD